MGDATDHPSDASLADRVARLHDALRATEERPVERTASRWIGEAQAIASDAVELTDGNGTRVPVVRIRVGHVLDMLENVEATGDEVADEHVATALSLAESIAKEDEDD